MEDEEKSGIVIATYNVLAAAHVKPEFFPRVDPALFAPAERYPRIAERVLGLNADVVCLQEADRDLYELLVRRLGSQGYRGHWAQKGEGKPDGCATFVRAPWLLTGTYVLQFADGGGSHGRSGHVALIAAIARDGRRLVVANTHLKWYAPEKPEERRLSLAQAKELAALLKVNDSPRVLCGDLNAELGGPILETFASVGFADAHPSSDATNNAGGVARKIDFLLHTAELVAVPRQTAHVADDTVLPSDAEPSDHVPLVATFS
jgi:mRNA deadenylase 3'-5' endonuclease subunit Ccr4